MLMHSGWSSSLLISSLERLAHVERWVELDERVRPEEAAVHLLLDKAPDIGVLDRQEAADVGAVVLDDVVA